MCKTSIIVVFLAISLAVQLKFASSRAASIACRISTTYWVHIVSIETVNNTLITVLDWGSGVRRQKCNSVMRSKFLATMCAMQLSIRSKMSRFNYLSHYNNHLPKTNHYFSIFNYVSNGHGWF